MFKHTGVFWWEMSMKALHNLRLHSDISYRMLLYIHALYKLADTRATRLMHWYVLSGGWFITFTGVHLIQEVK